ncbi:MAG TPA: hypothetical protein VHC72_04185 [Bryobacteraceae bacterium]|nr:hypothetical protein [Bryobacteraceae bacterium]
MACLVDLWTVSLLDGPADCLSPDEVARANRFRFERDRTRWHCARSSLRRILAGYTGNDPADLRFVLGEHGKPALFPLSNIQFNLSHSGDWALIAVTSAVPVGVDIERIRADLDMAPLLERLGERDLPAATHDLFRRWTQREATSKAAGGPLFAEPAANIRAVDVEAPEGYVAAVALEGYEPEVRYFGSR